MYGIIYKATFPNDKVYIGQTKYTLEQRKQQHYSHFKKSKNPKKDLIITRAFNKYGFENVTWEIIDIANNKEELDSKEIFWINYYRSYIGFSDANGYNATLGGSLGERFSILNEKELYQCGLEIKQGKSKKYIKEKYNLNDKQYNNISKGKQWRFYTKIAEVDYYMEEKSSVLTRFQVDKILREYKRHGDYQILAKEIGCSNRTVYEIIIGLKWSKYTGIVDYSFYYKYDKKNKKYKENCDIIFKLKKEGKTDEEISKIVGLSESSINRIISGRSLSIFTKIVPTTREENYEKGKINGAKITKEIATKIVELERKGYKPKEIMKELNLSKGIVYSILRGETWEKFTKYELTDEEKDRRKHGNAKITSKTVLSIVKDYNDGLDKKEIVNKYKVQTQLVNKILTGETWSSVTGIKYTTKKKTGEFGQVLNKEKVDIILKLREEGKTQKEIGEKLNIKTGLVSSVLTGASWSSYTGIQYNPKKRNKNK